MLSESFVIQFSVIVSLFSFFIGMLFCLSKVRPNSVFLPDLVIRGRLKKFINILVLLLLITLPPAAYLEKVRKGLTFSECWPDIVFCLDLLVFYFTVYFLNSRGVKIKKEAVK